MKQDVLIVGAGPVGLTLAIDLAKRGVGSVLIEKKEAPQFLLKMERCNARTLEIYRRPGLADKIMAAGLRADIPMDVYVILTMKEPPLLRLPYPSVKEARATIKATNDGTEPLIELPDVVARDIYGSDYLLVRPDMHIVWRGNAPPEDVEHVAGVVTGQRPLFSVN